MIKIDCIAHNQQRYETVGDWTYTKDGNLEILVSDTGNQDYNFLIGLHELVEAYLCKHAGISGAVVDEWDKEFPNEPDPGSLENAPYRHQHRFATLIERMMAHELDVDWNEYDKVLRKL